MRFGCSMSVHSPVSVRPLLLINALLFPWISNTIAYKGLFKKWSLWPLFP